MSYQESKFGYEHPPFIFAFPKQGHLSQNLLAKRFLLKLTTLVLGFLCVGLNQEIVCQVLAIIQGLISGQIF